MTEPMNNPKHTPTPWRVSQREGTIIECDEEYEYTFAGRGPERGQIAANAEYIVRACNSYPELLQIAKDLAAFGDCHCERGEEEECTFCRALIAIAKAQPEGENELHG